MSNLLKVKHFFDNLSVSNINLVEDFYSKDIIFIDPLVNFNNINDLKNYYHKLYSAVIDINFEHIEELEVQDKISFSWIMNLKATGIKSGELISVAGCSVIKFNLEGKAYYHRDYYDMGEFVYEKVPVLSLIINFIKNKLRN